MTADLHLKLGQQLSHFEWRHEQSEAEIRMACDLTRRLYGRDHVRTALAVYNLAHVLRRQHRVHEAERLYREVLEVQLEHCDRDHLDVLNTRMNLGIALGHRGNVEAARCELEDVVRLHAAKQPDHPKLAIALVALGDIERFGGARARAEECYRRALAIYSNAESFEHHNEIAWAHIRLALVFLDAAEPEAASELLHVALERNTLLFGGEHLAVAQVCAHLGTVHRLRGDFPCAREFYSRAVELYAPAAEYHPEGFAWASKHLELCAQASRCVLPIPAELVAARHAEGLGKCPIDWCRLIDAALASPDVAV